MNTDFIVITDLDGTLLDHHTYDYSPALPALSLLKKEAVPLILCSSKTAAEIASLRTEMDLRDPFIVENGAALYIPDIDEEVGEQWEIVNFGMNRADVLSVMQNIREQTGASYTGFADMTVQELVACTGLDETSASLALQREFTEPVLWQDSEENKSKFIRLAARQGVRAVQGGRFLHFSGDTDKGKAVEWLRKFYDEKSGRAHKTIVLGDSENDLGMLEKADYPVLIKSPVKDFPAINHVAVIKTQCYGPEGWNEEVIKLLTSDQCPGKGQANSS